MILLRHELRQGRTALAIWTAVIAGMMGVCILIYPEMAEQMGAVSSMFADMGSFSAAFGMDRINFGEFLGFFGVECGNILGLGGAFYAALLGISSLAKEERDQTAEFLLTHPVSRSRIVTEKLLAILLQLLILNLFAAGVSAGTILLIQDKPAVDTLLLLFLAYFLLQGREAADYRVLTDYIRRKTGGDAGDGRMDTRTAFHRLEDILDGIRKGTGAHRQDQTDGERRMIVWD